MAIVKPGDRDREQEEMAEAFSDDVPPPAAQSDDEAFGLTEDPAAPPDAAGGETPGANDANVAVETPEGAAEAPADEAVPPAEEGAVPPEAAAGEEVLSPEDEQRAKSWEGRMKKREAELAAREAELAAREAELKGVQGEAAAEGEPVSEEMAEQAAPGGDTDDGPKFDSADQAIAWATENLGPELVKVIDLIVDAKLKSGMGDIGGRLDSVLAQIQDRDVRDHFREIGRAHPDFLAVIKTPEFEEWRSGHEDSEHLGQVFDSGTADEVIEMLQAYKDAANQTQGTIAPDADDSAVAVRSAGGLRLPEEAEAMSDDYLDAFKEFASKD